MSRADKLLQRFTTSPMTISFPRLLENDRGAGLRVYSVGRAPAPVVTSPGATSVQFSNVGRFQPWLRFDYNVVDGLATLEGGRASVTLVNRNYLERVATLHVIH